MWHEGLDIGDSHLSGISARSRQQSPNSSPEQPKEAQFPKCPLVRVILCPIWDVPMSVWVPSSIFSDRFRAVFTGLGEPSGPFVCLVGRSGGLSAARPRTNRLVVPFPWRCFGHVLEETCFLPESSQEPVPAFRIQLLNLLILCHSMSLVSGSPT